EAGGTTAKPAAVGVGASISATDEHGCDTDKRSKEGCCLPIAATKVLSCPCFIRVQSVALIAAAFRFLIEGACDFGPHSGPYKYGLPRATCQSGRARPATGPARGAGQAEAGALGGRP